MKPNEDVPADVEAFLAEVEAEAAGGVTEEDAVIGASSPPARQWVFVDPDLLSIDADQLLEVTFERNRAFLKGVSSKLGGSRYMKSELLQEARIKLWELDPGRFDVGQPGDQAYLRKAVVRSMLRARYVEVRAMGMARYEAEA